jgi:hypothetical protein
MFDRNVLSTTAPCTVGVIEAVVSYVATLGHQEVIFMFTPEMLIIKRFKTYKIIMWLAGLAAPEALGSCSIS